MEKVKPSRRDIQFFSPKNAALLTVHNEKAKSYAQRLEKDSNITAYKACVLLDEEGIARVSPLDIRAEYFGQPENKCQWESNFLIYFTNGMRGVREITEAKNLEKRAVIEQLELSRRYWNEQGIEDWKIIIFQNPGVNREDTDYVF